MTFPIINNISKEEFVKAKGIFKIIDHNHSCNYVSFELKNQKYYISYFSPGINVQFLYLEEENYLLIGVDLKVVVISINVGSIVFSIGVPSFLKGFANTSNSSFTIFTELEDIIINKNGFSIRQTITHELEL